MKILLFALLLLQGPATAPNAGAVSGRILSDDGSPAVGVRVAAMPVPESTGPVSAPVLTSISQTDSAGNYRLENIPPGRYYVTAGLINAPMYFPGVTSPSASSVVNVTASSLVRNVDFRLPHAVNFKVSGRIVGLPSAAGPLRPIMITLLPRSSGLTPPFPTTLLGTNLTYEVVDIPPGEYSVQISGAGNATMKDVVVVTVNKDLTGVDLVLVDIGTRTRLEGLDTLWSLAGTWGAVASDNNSGLIYATSSGRPSTSEIDATGKIQREVPLPGVSFPRLAHFSGISGVVFLGGGGILGARDASGKLLWIYPDPRPSAAPAIDDLWPVDLDGDGSDEVVVGYNGANGVHVLDSQGKLIWKSTTIGNVWHVSGGDVRGNGKAQVVTTSALGKVHIFSDDGNSRVDLDPGVYANMVRVGKISEKDTAATIFAGGTTSDNKNAILTALSADGVKKWTLQLTGPGRPSFYSAYLAPGKPWMVLTMQTGILFVVDVERGAVIATLDGLAQSPEAAWLAGKGGADPMLVVAAKTGLTAYRVTGPIKR